MAFVVVGAAGFFYLVNESNGNELFKGEGLSQQELQAKADRLNDGYARIEAGAPPAGPETAQNQSNDDSTGTPNTATTAGSTGQTETNPETKSETKSTPAAQASAANTKETAGLPGRRTYNPLGDFSSYTYSLTLYMINPDTFAQYSLGAKIPPKDFYIIAQSGGINKDTAIDNPRVPGMNLDYHIDNLVIKTATAGQETLNAANSFDFSFNIFEPYGFSFPTKLVAAAKAIQAKSKVKRSITSTTGALQQQFLLSIRFYGYDKDGKVVTSKDYPKADKESTDAQAVFERTFPIQISKFDFKLDNKVVTYNVHAKIVSEQVAMGAFRGALKGNKTIEASTVGAALKNLIDELNKEQIEFAKPDKDGKKKIGVPDTYAIKFQDNSGIDTAALVDEKYYNKDRTPLFKVKNSTGSNVRASESAAVVQKTKRSLTFKDGLPIIQVIDQIVTQSDYVTQAFYSVEKEETVNDKDTEYVPHTTPSQLRWYSVCPHVVPKDQFDTIRNTLAYTITYVIQRYEIPYVRSVDIGYSSKYYGPHKRYEYTYTGKNTEILSYEQDYNLLYFNAASASSNAGTANTSDKSAPNAPVAGSGSDPTGRDSGWFEQINNLKTFLYSPADQLKARIKILGDPDYLMTATSTGINEMLKKWYGNNFTINPNSGQVFIEVNFNQAEDYSNILGVLEPNGNIQFLNYPPDLAIKGVTYQLTSITSTFSGGKFTQELSTVIPNLMNLSDSPKTGTVGAGRNTDPEPIKTAGDIRKFEAAQQVDQTPSQPTREELAAQGYDP